MFYLKHDLNPVEENSTCTTGAVIFDNKGCSTSGGHYNGNKWKDHWQVTESCYHKVIEFGSIIDKKVHVVVTCNRCQGTGQTSEWMGKEQVFLPDGRTSIQSVYAMVDCHKCEGTGKFEKDVAVIGQVAKDNEQARRDEKARIKQEKYEAWAKKVAEREYNYALICWANDIKRYAKKYDILQSPKLPTDKRTTIVGKVISKKEVDGYFSYSPTTFKMLVELDTGQKVFGTCIRVNEKGSGDYKWYVEKGDIVKFDAQLQEPKDCDGSFYFYKRPTKCELVKSAPPV
jgi:predicted nucleic-acid-binding Zn-ribbon protein